MSDTDTSAASAEAAQAASDPNDGQTSVPVPASDATVAQLREQFTVALAGLRADVDHLTGVTTGLLADLDDLKDGHADLAQSTAPLAQLGELAAMDATAQDSHGVSLGGLLAQLIAKGFGIDLHPRTVQTSPPGSDKVETQSVIGPQA